jgi:hypothetical protein
LGGWRASISVIMLDVDHFRQSTMFGHAYGDHLLIRWQATESFTVKTSFAVMAEKNLLILPDTLMECSTLAKNFQK